MLTHVLFSLSYHISGKVACQYGCSYYSFDGFGTAKIVEVPQEKIKALSVLMKTQTGKDFEFNEKLVSIVSVIRIDCDFFLRHFHNLCRSKSIKRIVAASILAGNFT